MKKYFVCVLGLIMVAGFCGLSSAAIVTDPTGDKFGTGATDITAARAEQITRGDGYTLMKVSYTATPNIGGLVIFEADVDSSTGTGGGLSMTGIPVSPCPCKITAGVDVAVLMMNRIQGPLSSSAMCEGCADSTASCASKRWPGEWYATAIAGTSTSGVIRGFSDPQPLYTTTSKCFTFPWDSILVYTRSTITNPVEIFNYADALDPATTKWQLSVWTDPVYSDQDDFGDASTFFNISDVVPNGNGVLANVDVADNLTFCEGNTDGDVDVDGTDAARFKSDFGRGKLLNPCPSCNAYY